MSSKTYSICFLKEEVNHHTGNKTGRVYWITNWGEFFNLDDIDWQAVDDFAKEGYGFYYGVKSRDLSSSRNRTVLYIRDDLRDKEFIN